MPRTNPAVTHERQPASRLCWATCIKMALSVRGHRGLADITPESIARSVLYASDADANVSLRDPIIVSACERYGIRVNYRPRRITWDELKAEIDGGRPLILGIKWGDRRGGGHAIVVGGYRESGGLKWVYVNDPEEDGETEVSFDRMVAGNYAQTGGAGWKNEWNGTLMLQW